MKRLTLIILFVLLIIAPGVEYNVSAQDQLWTPAPAGATLSVNEIVLIVILVVLLAFFGLLFWLLLARYGAAVDRLADATPAWMDSIIRDGVGRGLTETKRLTATTTTKIDDELLNAIEAALPAVLDRILGARLAAPDAPVSAQDNPR